MCAGMSVYFVTKSHSGGSSTEWKLINWGETELAESSILNGMKSGTNHGRIQRLKYWIESRPIVRCQQIDISAEQQYATVRIKLAGSKNKARKRPQALGNKKQKTT